MQGFCWKGLAGLCWIGIALAMAGCRPATAPSTPDRRDLALRPDSTALVAPTGSSTATPSRTPTPTYTATPLPAWIGPDYLFGFNPLTGMPVQDPGLLGRAPLLVSVTNFPPSARPQSGLSLASIVWEVSIGQGMSRFLAVYYGDYVDELRRLVREHPVEDPYGYVLAPIRSGRVVYEDIKTFYPDATLITRGASFEVRPQLSDRVGVYAANPKDVNSAGLTLAELETLPGEGADPRDYASLSFSSEVPPGGEPASSLRIIYNLYDHVGWEYDPSRRAYLRSQDEADGKGVLVPAVDRLTGEQLAFENVLLLFANHHFENVVGTILEIDIHNRQDQNGWLFRDGAMYPTRWSSHDGNLTLEAPDGSVLALRPGKTFIQVVSFETTWDVTRKLARFHLPLLPTLTASPSVTPSITPSPTITPELADPPAPEETPTPTETLES